MRREPSGRSEVGLAARTRHACRWYGWIALLFGAVASAQPPRDFTQGVSLTLGEQNEENGILLMEGRIPTRVVTVAGRTCRATDKAQGLNWMSFTAAKEYVEKQAGTGHALEVTYYDGGQGPVTLMYRARIRGYSAQHHLRIAQRTGGDTWKTMHIALNDADFTGIKNDWLVRLSGESWANPDLQVAEVRLDRRGLWLKADPEAVATHDPEVCSVRALFTDSAGEPVREKLVVRFESSAGTVKPEVVAERGVADTFFTPPTEPGEVDLSASCTEGRSAIKLPVVEGRGKVVSRKRLIGFEPGDSLEAEKNLKECCERLNVSLQQENAFEGSGAAKIDYSFEEGKSGLAGLHVGKEIPGRPFRIAVWSFSDGPACELNFAVKDAQGQVAQRHGATLWWKNWRLAENLMDSPQLPYLPDFARPAKYPLRLEHVLLRGMPNYGARYKRSGSLSLDYLVVEFLAAESGVPPIPVEATAKQVGDRLLVTLHNVSKTVCNTRAGFWLISPGATWVGPVPVVQPPLTLKAGEIVEFPVEFPVPQAPRTPDWLVPGEYTVNLMVVAVDTGDLVELETKWKR